MDMAENRPDPVAFPDQQARIAALREQGPVSVTAGHADLGPDFWLSCDPEGKTAMECAPADGGFRLNVTAGDSGKWTAMGMRLPREVLARGRYLGLLIEADTPALAAFTPRLRYHLGRDGIRDVSTPMPVVLPSGAQTHLAHIPLDPDLLGRAEGCELNLFFHTDAVDMRVIRLEPLLIS